ncbi:cilia- and flagella-associated protein 58-like isoform X1 [Synchiropus splendidus]|uniref:cilia- and flagella-associated protein 58-like isoform X1 n=1 Tax=Synchiropus splendidus TaxID=270530 RepID=UPI00237D70F0|nr:cilia- and flagella-associated protein 58-like isoform X1 [Synchiropus splendidus]
MELDKKDLIRINRELTSEKDQLMVQLENLRDKLNIANVNTQKVEALRESALEQISLLQQEVQVQQNEISREVRLKENLDKEVKHLQMELEAKNSQIKSLNIQAHKAKDEKHITMQHMKSLKTSNDKMNKELEQMLAKNAKLQQQCDQLSSARETLTLENQQKSKHLKMREEAVNHLNQEMAKQIRMREGLQKRLNLMEQQKADGDMQRETQKIQMTGLEKEVEACQKQSEADRKNIDELIREKEILNKNITKVIQATEKQQSIVKILELDKKGLEHEISCFRHEVTNQRKVSQQLEKERDRYINENCNLTQKVQQKMDDLEVKETELYDWKKKLTEAENKIVNLDNLLESAVSERNRYSKNIIECQAEIADLKRRIGTMNNQVTGLKDQLSAKELAQVKDQQEHKRLEKDIEALKGEVQVTKLQLLETKHRVERQKVEQQNLQKIIADGDTELFRLKKQLEHVVSERDGLGLQLLRRNDERALLYEKIKTQQSLISTGSFHYSQRVEDIRLLKREISKLNHKKNSLEKNLPMMECMRRELFSLQKELRKEKAMNRDLNKQLMTVNVHRWRRLEVTCLVGLRERGRVYIRFGLFVWQGSDPGRFKLIQKIQSLQKRLIAKTRELEEQYFLHEEKEKLYVELKQILARQPGPDAAEQIQLCHKALRDKNKKIQALAAKLSMQDAKMSEYRSDMQTMNEEMTTVKKKYFSQKRILCEQRLKSTEAGPPASQQPAPP